MEQGSRTTVILKKLQMLGDVSKFSWSQAFSDKTGKTSITSVLATVVVVPGMLIFTISGIAALFSVHAATIICANALAALGIGAALAGVNKVMAGKPLLEDHIADLTDPDAKDASDVSSPPNGPKE